VALQKLSLPKTKFVRSIPVTGPEAVSVAQAYDGIVTGSCLTVIAQAMCKSVRRAWLMTGASVEG